MIQNLYHISKIGPFSILRSRKAFGAKVFSK